MSFRGTNLKKGTNKTKLGKEKRKWEKGENGTLKDKYKFEIGEEFRLICFFRNRRINGASSRKLTLKKRRGITTQNI
jgi:hypothetical protein